MKSSAFNGHSVKIKRNQPCPCGSGKRYKRCHGKITSEPAVAQDAATALSIFRQIEQIETKQKAFEAAHGKGRPIISVEHNDWRFVAVGDKVHYSKADTTRFFPDFLGNYLRQVLGVDWGTAEIGKPLAERNQILQWYDSMCRYEQGRAPDAGGVYKTEPSGAMVAWYRLAYDLYLIKHNAELQTEILTRIRHRDQFQGARFELCVTASMVVAGFSINYEDERDVTRKHAEFIAQHASGIEVAVEAKSRHRNGVLGFRSSDTRVTQEINAEGILRAALAKQPGKPFFIFIDVNLPPSEMKIADGNSWLDELAEMTKQLVLEYEPDTFPANAIFFCNDPSHYSLDVPHTNPGFWTYEIPIERPRFPIDPNIGIQVAQAALQRSNVPNEFPA